MTQIRIGEKTYDLAAAGSAVITLKDILKFRSEATALLERPCTWDEIQALASKGFDEMEVEEQALMTVVMLWLTLRNAGEAVSLDQAADINDFEVLDDPEPAPAAEVGPTANPTDSVPAAEPVAVAP